MVRRRDNFARRISAILLLVAFSFPLIAAPFQDSDSSLPACCRRVGIHHCGMGHPSSDTADGTPKLNSRACPFFPTVGGFSSSAKLAFVGITAGAVAPDVDKQALSPESFSRTAASADDSHPKRGPPSLLHSGSLRTERALALRHFFLPVPKENTVPVRSLTFCLAFTSILHAAIFGRVQGLVHDPQHRPISGAAVTLHAANSDFSQSVQSDSNGEFSFINVPVGDYRISVGQSGFAASEQNVTVTSGSSPVLHFQLTIAPLSQTASVSGEAAAVNMDSVTPTTLVDREDIAETPGSDRSNSLAMITDYTPGSYVTHDMLHMRGGHQVSWLIDGVPIPNTNIAMYGPPRVCKRKLLMAVWSAQMYSAFSGIFRSLAMMDSARSLPY